jgi:hypothetical protein
LHVLNSIIDWGKRGQIEAVARRQESDEEEEHVYVI